MDDKCKQKSRVLLDRWAGQPKDGVLAKALLTEAFIPTAWPWWLTLSINSGITRGALVSLVLLNTIPVLRYKALLVKNGLRHEGMPN